MSNVSAKDQGLPCKITSGLPPDHLDQWVVHFSPPTSDFIADHRIPEHLRFCEMAEWFHHTIVSNRETGPKCKVQSVIVSLTSALDIARLMQQSKSTVEKEFVGEIVFGGLSSQVVWYWHNDWRDCIHEFRDIGPISVGIIDVFSPISTPDWNQKNLNEISAQRYRFYVLACESVSGFVIKHLERNVGMEETDISQSREGLVEVRQIPQSSLDTVRDIARDAVSTMLTH